MLFRRAPGYYALILGAALLSSSGCSTSGTSFSPAISAQTSNAVIGGHDTTKAAFTIRWPKRRERVRGVRGFRWISPATASVIVVVNGSVATFANAPKKGRVSTIEIDAPAGQDTFDITLYDALQKQHEQAPQGNALGKAIVVQTIVAGKSNVIKATIAGIPSRVVATPIANQPFVRSDGTGGYDIIGDSPQRFVVTAQDADGNAIVPQPSVAMSPTTATAPYFAVTPNTKQPQQFGVAAVEPNPPANGVMTQLSISTRDENGNSVSDFVVVTQLSAIYVSFGHGVGGAPTVAAYDGTGTAVHLAKEAFRGLKDPRQLAYDDAHHRLYVADAAKSGGEILAFDALGNPVAGFTLKIAGANAVAYDPNNGLLYAGNSKNSVKAYTSNGKPVSGTGSVENGSTSAIGYYPTGPEDLYPSIVVANGRASGPSAPLLWFYDENLDGNYSTAPPQLSGVADVTTLSTISGGFMIMCGTPAIAGGDDLLMEPKVPYSFNTSTADVPGCQGVAFDPLSQEVFVPNGSGNAVIAMQLTDLDEQLGAVDPKLTITPSGLSDPLRVAITF